jgi:hypothetical protein
MLCNLSPNRGIVDVAEASPRTRVIIGRSCLEFEAVTDVAALGGRLASEPEGDGQGGGNEEWFGVYLYRPKI